MEGLCLSLGHNSSAIYVRNGQILGGYETERLTGVKSDSSFPKLPIEQLRKFHHFDDDIPLFVGHWALDGQLSSMKEKHWDVKYIKENFPNSKIYTLSKEFTHHDSHAYSALAFSEWKNDAHCIVMDGFGTMGEHMSVYKVINGVPVLQWRKFGFQTSLGLLYQYTTGFLGMKQNQDEYKLLAFEAHISDVLPYVKMADIRKQITRWTDHYLENIEKTKIDPGTDPLCNLGALPEIAERIANMHLSVYKEIGAERLSDKHKRIITAYFTQALVENVVASIVRTYAPTNLVVAGGLFYNVKLNNLLSRLVAGKFCAFPLCGDQGAALGIYHATYPISWPDHLYWGHRPYERPESSVYGLYTFDTSQEDLALKMAADILDVGGYVNIVRGAMEFGPRALCHTTTLAVAKPEIAAYINKINARTNEMPFAPVVTAEGVHKYFRDVDKIHKSLEYMIVTRDFDDNRHLSYMGAVHCDYDRKVFTGRPQVSNDPFITPIVDQYGMLINTSYNFHGVPIVYNMKDILYTRTRQMELADRFKPVTIVVN